MVDYGLCPCRLSFVFLTLLVLLSIPVINASGQTADYAYFYRIEFTDKGSYEVVDFELSDLVSPKAIERRKKSGILLPDYSDLPVYEIYLDQVKSLGLKLHTVSKWMNTALFKSETQVDINPLNGLPFVRNVRVVKSPAKKGVYSDKLEFKTEADGLSPYDRPLSMVNAIPVHNSGFNGKGIIIAVLDAGYTGADQISSLNDLRNRDGIKGTFDLIGKSSVVYGFHNHGTAVLSVLAGSLPGLISGSAPGADYWLLRTEDPDTEYPVEEDYWIAGAEFADSIGADIISSSLGYFTFDDPLLNYKYSDMDGNTALITKAADIAASKGILVVCSAGNERNKGWMYIIAPADGDSVLAVGAVDADNLISAFSSAGPSYDGRIKPDVVAQGVSIPVQVQTSTVVRSSGTSFSCPVISGVCACIMQAVPKADNQQILNGIRYVSDRYLSPDSLYGYGIPDMVMLIRHLQELVLMKPPDGSALSPNPFMDHMTLTLKETPEQLAIEIFSLSGKLISQRDYGSYVSRSILLDGLQNLDQGVYFVRIITNNGSFIHKVIKIRR